MSFFLIKVDRDKLKKLGHKARDVRRAQQYMLEEMAREWHDRFLPLHFQPTASRRYSYTARKGERADNTLKRASRKYSIRKLRRFGHMKPLVWSGEGEMLSRMLRLRSTSNWAKVILPSKFNFRNQHSRVSMRDEITRILPSEAIALRRVGAAALKAKLSELKA